MKQFSVSSSSSSSSPLLSPLSRARIEPLEPRLLMAVWSVINNNDSGAGSLRAAIAGAASNDTINFNTTGQITLLSPLTVSKSLTVTNATGVGPITISGNGSSNLFVTTASLNLKLLNLNLIN